MRVHGTTRSRVRSVAAITLDLDDTLWPFAPIAARIEQVLHAWFERHSLATARAFPPARMRQVRAWMVERHPELTHDASALRLRGIEHALRESGGDTALAQTAYDAFYAERNRVEFYEGAVLALERIAARWPVCAITNGNADLGRIGIAQHFTHCLSARAFGAGKPEAGIFLHACALLRTAPAQVLHIGDDAVADVAGARGAGLRVAWIDHAGHGWPPPSAAHPPWAERLQAIAPPDAIFPSLAACADWLLNPELSNDTR